MDNALYISLYVYEFACVWMCFNIITLHHNPTFQPYINYLQPYSPFMTIKKWTLKTTHIG